MFQALEQSVPPYGTKRSSRWNKIHRTGRIPVTVKLSSIMQSTLTVGQVVQPSILSIAEGIVKNLKGWLHANSASFSAIAGEKVSRLDVVKAHLYLAFVFAVMFIVSNMGGVIS